MIECHLTKEQLEEALVELNIAHSNGWIASKVVFKLKYFNDADIPHKHTWDLDRGYFMGDPPYIIVDGGALDGSTNFGRTNQIHRDYTVEKLLEKNKKSEERWAKINNGVEYEF